MKINTENLKSAIVAAAGIVIIAAGVSALTFLTTTILQRAHVLSQSGAIINGRIRDLSAYATLGICSAGLIANGVVMLACRKELFKRNRPLLSEESFYKIEK